MATTIRFSKLSISPQLDMAPGFGTGTNNPGYATEYEMGYTGDGYDHAFIAYQGDDTADLSTTSAITDWTFTDPLGYTFTAPTGNSGSTHVIDTWYRIVDGLVVESGTVDPPLNRGVEQPQALGHDEQRGDAEVAEGPDQNRRLAADRVDHAGADDERREEQSAGEEGVADRGEAGIGRRNVGHGVGRR